MFQAFDLGFKRIGKKNIVLFFGRKLSRNWKGTLANSFEN